MVVCCNTLGICAVDRNLLARSSFCQHLLVVVVVAVDEVVSSGRSKRKQLQQDWSRVHGPGDDEEEFGGNHAERTGGHACAVGRSLAVHFSYGP